MPSGVITAPDLGSTHTHSILGHGRQPWLNTGHILPPPPGLNPVVRRCTAVSHMAFSILIPPLLPCPGFAQALGLLQVLPGFTTPRAAPVEGANKKPNPVSAFLTDTPSPRKAKQNEGLSQTAGSWKRAVSLTYLSRRQRAQKSDQHKVQILSKAAALGALVPGDRAKTCIKQFTALTRPEFSGIQKVRTNQVPWQGPAPTPNGQATPQQLSHHQLC